MRIYLLILPLCFALYFSSATQSFGHQGPGDSCDVPLVVTRFVPSSKTVELVKNLGPKDLTVQLGAVPGTLESVSIDDGPKRIALVLDTSDSIPANEWKLQTEMAAKLVQHARPDDSFAVLFVGIESPASEFSSSAEIVRELQKLSSSRPLATESGERIYDALLAAANRLNPSEFGDAVFLFGHPEDSGSKTEPDKLMEVVLKNRLRFYAVSFSDPLLGKLPPGFDLNKQLPASVVRPKLTKMTAATGYGFSFHSIESLNYPGQIPLFENYLADLYAGIAQPYRLKLAMPDTRGEIKLAIVVNNSKERNINEGDIHYPHSIYPCLPSAPTMP
jgi:von Willebrand factor type A domain